MNTQLRNGLVCWYDFVRDRTGRSDIYDFSGNGHDLIIENPQNVVWLGNDNIVITDDGALSSEFNIPLTAMSTFTISYRVYSDANPYDVFGIQIKGIDDEVVSTFNYMKISEMHYVAFSFDLSTETGKAYLNGSLKRTYAVPQSVYVGKTLSKLLIAGGPSPTQITYGDIRIYDRQLSDEEIYNLVYRKSFIDESGRVYSKSFNTDQVITPKIKETGLDYPIFDGTKLGVNLSETTLGCNDIEGI
jgi:hypothetical protein